MRRVQRWRLLAAAGLIVVFAVLAVIATRSPADGFDQAIEVRVHRWVVAHPPWPRIAEIAGIVTQPLVVRLLALVAAIALVRKGLRREGIWLVATIAVTTLSGILLKLVFARPRPVWPDPITVFSDYSFPSGHALHAAAGATATIVLLNLLVPQSNPRAHRLNVAGRVGVTVTALLTGLDRVALGVHYPTDVLAGWALGIAIVLLAPGPAHRPT